MISGKRAIAVLIVLLSGAFSVGELLQIQHTISPAWSDLYPQWIATKAAIRGEDPYSDAVTREIQRGFYGRELTHGDKWDQQNFVYPATLIPLLAPLAWLPWTLVRILLTLAAPFTIAATIYAWIQICDLRLSSSAQILAYGIGLTSWPAAWAYQQTQPTIFIFAAITFSLLFYKQRRSVPAGILLALSTTKPTLVALLALWLVFDAAIRRRRSFIVSFAVSIALLSAAANFIVPGWLFHWLQVAGHYAGDPLKISMLQHIFGHKAGLTASILLAAAIVLEAWQCSSPTSLSSEFGHMGAILLAFTVCLIPITPWMVYDQLLLIPAALLLLFQASKRARRLALIPLSIGFAATAIGCFGGIFSYLCLLSWFLVAPAMLLLLILKRHAFSETRGSKDPLRKEIQERAASI